MDDLNQSQGIHREGIIVIVFFIGLAFTAVLTLALTQQTQAGFDCSGNSWTVTNETDLNNAIACFNANTTTGNYNITFAQNISLTNSTITISNSITNLSLLIEGNRFVIDRQDLDGVRPFTINPNTSVTIQNLTMSNGDSDMLGGAIYNDGTLSLYNSSILFNFGGTGTAIYNNGNLHIATSTIGHNRGDTGAGIYNNGTVTITNSTISNNSADNGAGIFNNGTVTITASTLDHNRAENGGGGIFNNTLATVTVNNSIIANSHHTGGFSSDCTNSGGTINDEGHNIVEDNSCGFTGGSDPMLTLLQDHGGPTLTKAPLPGSPAINNGSNSFSTDQRGVARPQGGTNDIGAYELYDCTTQPWIVGIEAGLRDAINCFNTTTISNSYTISLTQNISLTESASTFENTTSGVDLLFEGNGFTVDGQGIEDVRPFENSTDTHVAMQNISITGGNPPSFGGGIKNSGYLTFTNGTISGNSTHFSAGGIYNTGTLILNNSEISNNTSNDGHGNGAGGGILNSGGSLIVINSVIKDNLAYRTGGGIHISNYGLVTLNNSTIKDNTAVASSGGGIFNYNGTLHINQSTINGNTARYGGGINNNDDRGVTYLTNSTISNNRANSYGGGISNHGVVTVTNSTISHNSSTNPGGGLYNFGDINLSNSILANSLNGGDCITYGSGSVIDNGFNIIEDNSCGLTGGSDPLLGPLQNNGGSTFTHALLLGSPALDAGDTSLLLDQRGGTRPQGSSDDIGAYEAVQYPLTIHKEGTGTGFVTSTPAGIDCGNTCTSDFVAGNVITLTANPDISAVFVGWHGAGCSGTGNCVLTMNAAKTVTATFDMIQHPLSISKEGAGTGSVVSTPAGIGCGNTCTNDFVANTIITLTAMADTNSLFTGWAGGGCTGTSNCVVTMDAAKLVTATFKTDYTLYLPFIINTSTSTQAE